MTNKAILFIDWEYLSAVKKRIPSAPERIDMTKFTRKLIRYLRDTDELADLILFRTYIYAAPPYFDPAGTVPEQYKSYTLMTQAWEYDVALTVRHGERREDGTPKEVTTKLSLDMVLLAQKHAMDVAVIIAGDDEYVPAAELVKQEGIHVAHMYGRREYVSKKIQRCADRSIQIEDETIQTSGVDSPR